VGNVTREVLDFVDTIEAKSYEICEICGGKGTPSDKWVGWIRTLCPEHKKIEPDSRALFDAYKKAREEKLKG
jgi:hypothetical protein